jgi:Bacterial regulatory helix-turn-helix protein, lysR family/LysR substrate binding domain
VIYDAAILQHEGVVDSPGLRAGVYLCLDKAGVARFDKRFGVDGEDPKRGNVAAKHFLQRRLSLYDALRRDQNSIGVIVLFHQRCDVTVADQLQLLLVKPTQVHRGSYSNPRLAQIALCTGYSFSSAGRHGTNWKASLQTNSKGTAISPKPLSGVFEHFVQPVLLLYQAHRKSIVSIQVIDVTDLRLFDLNLLVAFDALVAERSVTRAAQRVGIGQPAMSHALSRLRELFGDSLFVRTTDRMRPTTRALELAAPIARVLADIRESVLADRAFAPDRTEMTLRVGASDQNELAVLPAVLTALRSSAPKARIVVNTVDRDRLETTLESGAIDLAIGYFPDAANAGTSEVLFREEFVCLFDAKASPLQQVVTESGWIWRGVAFGKL